LADKIAISRFKLGPLFYSNEAALGDRRVDAEIG
jgi:hypothetical protein